MNITNKIKIGFTAIALAALAIGCATESTQQLATEQALITTAAATGTELALQKYPQYLGDFATGEEVLSSISTGTNAVTVTSVEGALTQAGETNAVVATSIVNAITLADTLIANAGSTNSAAQVAQIREVCGWVATGIGQGVATDGD